MTDKRVIFDFALEFANGGGIQGQGFRLDLHGDDIGDDQLAEYIIRDLRLLMVARVHILNKRIVAEPHKRADEPPASMEAANFVRYVDLSHTIERDMVSNTGTCLNTPYLRHEGGFDLAGLPLEFASALPGLVVRTQGAIERRIDWTMFAASEIAGRAVLVHTGWDSHWRTDRYFEGHPFLTEAAAVHLRDGGARLVGIDAPNIDDTFDATRPVHAVLLGAGIPIVEDLTNLGSLPIDRFRFHAAPPKIARLGTFPVRAHAVIA
jgi:kynurenine formamidase